MNFPNFNDLGGFNEGILHFLSENRINLSLEGSLTEVKKTQNIFNAIIAEIDKPQNEDALKELALRELFGFLKTNGEGVLDLGKNSILILPAYKKIIDVFNEKNVMLPNDHSRFNRKVLDLLSKCGISISVRSSPSDERHTRDIFEAIIVEMDKSQDPEAVLRLRVFLEKSSREIEKLGEGFYSRTLEAVQKQLERKVRLRQKGIDPLLWDVKDISERKLPNLSDLVSILKHEKVREGEIFDIISVLKHVSEADLEKFTELAVILKRSYGDFKIKGTLLAIKDASGERLSKLLDLARFFKAEGVERVEICSLLFTLKDTQKEELDKIFSIARSLKDAEWKGLEIYNILGVLRDVPEGKIDKFLAFSEFLKKQGVDGDALFLVLSVLKDALEGNLDKLLTLTVSLKDMGLERNDLFTVLTAFKNASEERIDKFIGLVESIKGVGLGTDGIFSVLVNLKDSLEEGDLDKIFALVIDLRRKGFFRHEIVDVLTGLKEKSLGALENSFSFIKYLKKNEIEEFLPRFKEASEESISQLLNVVGLLEDEQATKEDIKRVILSDDFSVEHLKKLGEALLFFKTNSPESFHISSLIDVYEKGVPSAEGLLGYKTAEELRVVIELAKINKVTKESLLKIFVNLPSSEALQFIQHCDSSILQKLFPKSQRTSIGETVFYYLCANKLNNSGQKTLCLRFLKEQILQIKQDHEAILEFLKNLPVEVKTILAKEVFLKSEDTSLIGIAQAMLASEESSTEQQCFLDQASSWEFRLQEFAKVIDETKLFEEQKPVMKEVLAALTLRQDANYTTEQLVFIINQIKHIPMDQISPGLLSMIPPPEASFEEMAEALHPCHILAAIPSSELSRGSLELANITLHLKGLQDLDRSFDSKAVSRYLNDVLKISQGSREIFEQACQLVKRYQISLEVELISPVMTCLFSLCEDEKEFMDTLALAMDREESIPVEALGRAMNKIPPEKFTGFINQASDKILYKLSEPVEITSTPFAVLLLLIAGRTGNEALKEDSMGYLKANAEDLERQLNYLKLLPANEKLALATHIFVSFDESKMFRLARELFMGNRHPLPPSPMWEKELGWIYKSTEDPITREILKEQAFSNVDPRYDENEFRALATNILFLPSNLRKKICSAIIFPSPEEGEEHINLFFNLVNILDMLASQPTHKELLQEFLEYLFSGKPKEQYTVGYLLQPDFWEEDQREACLEVVGTILKTSDRLEGFQKRQLDVELGDDKKSEIVEKLFSQSNVIIQEVLQTIVPEDRLPEIKKNIREIEELDELIRTREIELPLGEDLTTLKNTIRNNLSDYGSREPESLVSISFQLLKNPKEIRPYVLRVLFDRLGDKAFEPHAILCSLSPKDPLLSVYLQALSLSKEQRAIQELLEKMNSTSELAARTTYEVAISAIMCDNQELRDGLESFLRTPLFSKKDLTRIKDLAPSTQDTLLLSLKKTGKDPDFTIQKDLMRIAEFMCLVRTYRVFDKIVFDDDHPIECIKKISDLLYQKSGVWRRKPMDASTFFNSIKTMNLLFLERINILLDQYPDLSDQQILSIVSNIQELEGQIGAAEVIRSLLMQNPDIPLEGLESVDLFIKAIKELLPTEEISNITMRKIRNCLRDNILPELYLNPQAIEKLTLVDLNRNRLPPKLEEARQVFRSLRGIPFYADYQYILYNLEMLGDKKNCYRVYASIKETQKRWISPREINIPSFTYEVHPSLEGLEVDYESSEVMQASLNIKGFQEKTKTFSLSVKDLPGTVTADTPLRLFAALKDKILALDPAIQSRIKAKLIEVLEAGGQVSCSARNSINSLLDRLIIRFKGNDYADKLMHGVPEDPDALIDQDTYRLHIIFDYIQKLSNEPKDEDMLSDQDDYLMLTFANIQQCSTGQSEGIAQIYTLTQDNILSLRAQESGEKFIDKFIQDSLSGALKTEGLDNKQQVHQDLYLKNMLYDWIGLKHSLTFDQYTHLLNDDLIVVDKKRLLEVFYQKFPNPIQLCKNLQKHINSSLSKAYPMIAPLLDEDPVYWDEEGKISIQGCFCLLERLHYLNITRK